jgi:hypothetical protein
MENFDINKLPPQARIELIYFYEFLLEKYTPFEKVNLSKKNLIKNKEQPYISQLALKLFGSADGVNLELPQYPPHLPLDFKL